MGEKLIQQETRLQTFAGLNGVSEPLFSRRGEHPIQKAQNIRVPFLFRGYSSLLPAKITTTAQGY